MNTPKAAPVAVEAVEREKFEERFDNGDWIFARDSSGVYADVRTHDAWIGWNARAELARPLGVEVTDAEIFDAARKAGLFGFEDSHSAPLLRFAQIMLAEQGQNPVHPANAGSGGVQGGEVTIPRSLAIRTWAFLAQDCSPCMDERCQIDGKNIGVDVLSAEWAAVTDIRQRQPQDAAPVDKQIADLDWYLKANYPKSKGETTTDRAIFALEEMDVALGMKDMAAGNVTPIDAEAQGNAVQDGKGAL